VYFFFTAKKRKLDINKYLENLIEEKRLKREADDKKHNEKMELMTSMKKLLDKFLEK